MKMVRYYIKNRDNEYWSANKKFGYWSKLNDIDSINNRRKYPKFLAEKLQILMAREGIKTTLELINE